MTTLPSTTIEPSNWKHRLRTAFTRPGFVRATTLCLLAWVAVGTVSLVHEVYEGRGTDAYERLALAEYVVAQAEIAWVLPAGYGMTLTPLALWTLLPSSHGRRTIETIVGSVIIGAVVRGLDAVFDAANDVIEYRYDPNPDPRDAVDPAYVDLFLEGATEGVTFLLGTLIVIIGPFAVVLAVLVWIAPEETPTDDATPGQ